MRGWEVTGTPIHFWQESKMIQPPSNSLVIFYKIRHIFTIQSSNLTARYSFNWNDNYVHENTYMWIFIVVLFIIAPNWEPPKCPSAEECINKSGTSIQRNKITTQYNVWTTHSMDDSYVHFTKWKNPESKGYILWFHFYDIRKGKTIRR